MIDLAKQARNNQYVVLAMSALLIFGAINAVMVTADEYDPEIIVWMNLGLDLALTLLLPVLWVQVARRAQPSGLKPLTLVVGVAGSVAGLVKLAIRFTSDHGWWTGHLNYAF